MRRGAVRAAAAARVVPRHRHLTTGGATVAGLDAFAARFDGGAARRRMPRTGWALPRVAFGGDDLGASGNERAGLLLEAVLRKGANALLIDGDHVYARREHGGDLWTHRAVERDWEAAALTRLWASGIDRSEVVLMVRLSVAAGRGSLEDLRARLAALLVLLDLQRVDVLHVSVPPDATAFPAAALETLFAECEALVGGGYAQYYGLACEAFTAVDSASVAGGVGTTLQQSALSMGQPLRAVFVAAERVRGQAAAVRRRADEAAPAVVVARMPGAGNAFSRAVGAAPSLAVPAAPVAPPPPADRHHLVSLMYSMALTQPWPAVPAVTDGAGGTPLSSSDLIARYGLAQFVRGPFDAWPSLPAADTLLRIGGGAPSSDERLQRHFRCVATSVPRRPASAAAVAAPPSSVAAPSADSLAQLSDALNAAVHLEFAWESKGVRDAVAEAARAGDAAAASNSKSSEAATDTLNANPKPYPIAGVDVGVAAAPQLDAAAAAQLALLTAPDAAADDSTPGLSLLLPDDVTWARTLAANLDRLDSWSEWRELRGRRLMPALSRVAAVARGAPAAREWTVAYVAALSEVAVRVDALQESGQALRASRVGAALDAALPVLSESAPLHVKVARLLLAAAPGVDSLLTEVPEAFGVRRRSQRAVSAAREASIGTAASAAVARGSGAAASGAGGDAAMDARLAARAAEIDALIAGVVAAAAPIPPGSGGGAPTTAPATAGRGPIEAGGAGAAGNDGRGHRQQRGEAALQLHHGGGVVGTDGEVRGGTAAGTPPPAAPSPRDHDASVAWSASVYSEQPATHAAHAAPVAEAGRWQRQTTWRGGVEAAAPEIPRRDAVAALTSDVVMAAVAAAAATPLE